MPNLVNFACLRARASSFIALHRGLGNPMDSSAIPRGVVVERGPGWEEVGSGSTVALRVCVQRLHRLSAE
eukprot:6196713-Prymnesium_polylepis.1